MSTKNWLCWLLSAIHQKYMAQQTA